MKFSGVILAGGASSRMGRDKALLPYGGQTLLAHQLETLSLAGLHEQLIAREPDESFPSCGCPVVRDSRAGVGPLGGVIAALEQARGSHLVVLAVDMPAVTPAYLKKLLALCSAGRGAVPHQARGYEPLAAVYPGEVLPVAAQCLEREEYSMHHVVRACVAAGLLVGVSILPEELPLFANWNRPQDIRPTDLGSPDVRGGGEKLC